MPLRLDNARALTTCPQQSNSRRRRPSSRDSRLTPRLHRCQKPSSQNASRPGRHQIGRVGEIILESWATSNRYTRARSSESAVIHKTSLAGEQTWQKSPFTETNLQMSSLQTEHITYDRSARPVCEWRYYSDRSSLPDGREPEPAVYGGNPDGYAFFEPKPRRGILARHCRQE